VKAGLWILEKIKSVIEKIPIIGPWLAGKIDIDSLKRKLTSEVESLKNIINDQSFSLSDATEDAAARHGVIVREGSKKVGDAWGEARKEHLAQMNKYIDLQAKIKIV